MATATKAKAKPNVAILRAKIAKVQKLREKIAARKEERVQEQKQQFAKMRLVAAKAPEKLEKCLAGLADKCASMAEGWENLRENLGLVKAPREAALKLRVAAAKNYGKNFKRIAAEAPDKLESAMSEAYQGLNDIAADIEMAAEQMGVSLQEDAVSPFAEVDDFGGEGFGDENLHDEAAHDIIEEADADNETPGEEHIEEHEEEIEDEDKEASGSDSWVTDRNEDGQPQAPVIAGGSDGFSTDRDDSGSPNKPGKLGTRTRRF